MTIVLASASPRRKELLDAAGIPCEVRPVDVDESLLPGEDVRSYVQRIAGLKAAEAARRWGSEVVIAADTAVRVGSNVLGKPKNVDDAGRMVRLLAGRAHEVLTGVEIRWPRGSAALVESTTVLFRQVSEDEVKAYVESGEPMDKAGAYAIQGLGSRFVTRIEGSYTNVVGLPVAAVDEVLRRIGCTGRFPAVS
jgi:septum formation protein